MRTVLYLALSLWSVLLTSEAKAVRDCTPQLKAQIQMCLLRFEGLLVVYQRPATSDTQRHNMLSDMCHQYEETLQCLHESLLRCVADQASLQLIASRLGPVRNFMEVTCYITPRRITPTPATPRTTSPTTPSTSHSPSTTETMAKTTAIVLPHTSTDIPTTTTTGSKPQTTALHTTTTTDVPTTTTTKKRTTSRTIPPTTPSNVQPKLHTNTKDLLGAKTEQTLVGNVAMTDSVYCENIGSSEHRLRCLQQSPTVNAASTVSMCSYTAAHLGALIAVIITTVSSQ